MTSSSFTNQIENVPFFNGANAEFPKFTRDMVTFAKQHGLYKVFTEEVEIPDANKEKFFGEAQAMNFAEGKQFKHFFFAWKILSRAIKCKTDNVILRRVTSPNAAWLVLIRSCYSTTTRGVILQRTEVLTNKRVKPGYNPIYTRFEMADHVGRDLRANGTDTSDEIVCLLFL